MLRGKIPVRIPFRGGTGRPLSSAGGGARRGAGRHPRDLGNTRGDCRQAGDRHDSDRHGRHRRPSQRWNRSGLARPEGNITGFATLGIDLEGKRLELLKDLLPQLTRVGILGNAGNPYSEAALENVRRTAEPLRVALELVAVRNADQVEDALLQLDQARPDAVLVFADTLLLTKRNLIVAALARSRLPAVYPYREYAEAGGLVALGANFGVLFERAAAYVDRILKGARPADLPIQLATEFELVINRKAAAAVGLNSADIRRPRGRSNRIGFAPLQVRIAQITFRTCALTRRHVRFAE